MAKWMDERLKADGIDWRNVDRPLYVMGSGFANGRVGHAYGDELLPTLRTKSGDVIVMPGGKVYRVTGRVLARVTGIGDDYKMPHSEALSHTIIGNGVPVQLTQGVIAPLLQHSDPKFSLRDGDGNTGEDDGIKFSLPTNIKKEKIRKLRESEPVVITGQEIPYSDDLKQYKKNAFEYGKNLRGDYTNEDTGDKIGLTAGNKRGGLREILQHDYKDIEHLQSIAAIPQIIEKSIFVEELPNEDVQKYPGVRSYRYYVCGLKIGGTDYTVKAVVAVQDNGNRYYDHRLTKIEKGKLLSIVPTIQKAGIENSLPNSLNKFT